MPLHNSLAHRLQPSVGEFAPPAEAAATHDAPVAFAAFLAAWVGVGLLQAWILSRRGHDAHTMGALGAGLGPLMTIVTVDTIRHREPEALPVVVDGGVARSGELEVLVLLEGSAEAALDVADTVDAVRDELRRVTIARVVPFEAVEHGGDSLILDAAIADVRGAAAAFPDIRPELIVLPGHPSTAPQHFARRRAIDLVLHAHDVPSSVTHHRQ